ncbi:Integrase catalytic core [Arabidopsis thaliana x Arabidopsis arenosa]|uniref:Integrase catalytic core n=1 Tax=Arabidopsis thaliana x Arabidopsis arenosa TaxID=1240361 RepID=A0A8T2A3A1_9BRAS|nr:Integrase catalytic core [Arabidopsis thaliana x Arabidopsis arenosa]
MVEPPQHQPPSPPPPHPMQANPMHVHGNLDNVQCPQEYRKELAVQYLKDEAQVLSGLARMEDHNHLPEHLDDPPPRRNDREAAGPEGENNAAGQNEEHIAVHDGAHELDYLDPLIGDFDAPHLHFQSRSAINPTRPQHESFKISPQLINLVKENQFHGFATEIPIAHIDLFEEICDTTSSDEEANNYRKCKLFSFSLGEKASKWLKSLPQASITNWEDYKAAFLNHFYTKTRTNLVRARILGFKQGAKESFYDAWERFKDYDRDCPHHGYTEGNMMNTFYRGVHHKFRFCLDTASTGDFATKTVEEARSLISNLAVSDNNNLLDPSLTMDKEAIHLSRFDELMEMMNTAVKCLQEVTSSSSEEDDDFYGREEDVNYMGARRGYQGRVFNQSFRNRGRNTNQKSVNNKIHEMYEEIKNKVVTLSDKVEGIYKQNTETAFIVVTFTEPFMRKYKQPLYAHLNAITLRSGLAYKEPIDPRYQEEEQPLPHPRPGRRPVTGEEQPEPALSTRPVTSPVTDGREAAKMPSRPVTQLVTGGDPSDHTGHSTAAGGDVAEEPLNREGVIPTPPLRPERVYQPKVPYPNASKTSKKERERAKLKELIGQLTVRLPFVEACAMIPTLRKYMKSILTNNISLEDGVMMITQDCSAILQNRSPQKRGDPGSFVLSCTIGEEVFEHCLCDLGSSINMMPLSTAKCLGHHSFKPTKISLVLADRSIRRPIGVLLDIPITIGECQIPTDFIVLEVEKEPKDPLILGRPFLSTAGANIDVPNGKIDLHLGDFVMKFDMNETLKQASSHNQVFSVDKVEEATNELCEEIILDDPLEMALTEAKDDYVFLMESVENSAETLDSAECYTRLVAYLDLDEESSQPAPPKDTPSDVANPWSELRAPKVELKQLPIGLRYAFLGPNCTYPVIINSGLDSKETTMLLSDLRKHRKALGYSLEDIPGISPDLCMNMIHLEEGAKNSIEHQRRLNLVKKEIMKLLEAGIIYHISDSTWVSPVHVVPKKGGVTVIKSDNDELIATRTIIGHRMCIDYRKLSAATRKDHFPLPFIDQMPFGLCNASATFQRCIMSIFTEYIEDFMEVFIDDFSVYGSSFEACLANLGKVLQRCEDKHLVLNWEKCHFMVRDGIVLGHRISEKGIEVDKAKIEVMMSLQPPTNVRGIRSFLGHAGFYRRFIQDFSKNARPLTRLLCKDVEFEFDEECLVAFQKIKNALVSAPVVQPLDWELSFEIMCDASDYAVGAVLGQRKDKKLNVIYYASRTLDEAQCNYATTEKELLAIIFAFEKFRSYLDAKPRLIRWIFLLQEFDIEVRDRKGADNGVADHLSRMRIDEPIPLDDSLPEENVYVIDTVPIGGVPAPPQQRVARFKSYDTPWFRYYANYLAADVAIPSTTNDASVLVKMFKNIIFPRFGVPRVVISDGGRHFVNATMKALFKKNGVVHKVSSPYHPQTSGQVEISNREIKTILQKTTNRSSDWATKLDDALWAYRTAYKTPLGTTPFHCVYGKACHLPIELEYKAAWAVKELNFNLKTAAERRLIQLNELDEIRHNAYENSRIYKERTKAYHDKKIVRKSFAPNDQVLLFNSRLKLFPGKLRSRWSGPFRVKEVRPYGAVVLLSNQGKEFVANGQRLKPYFPQIGKDAVPTVPTNVPYRSCPAVNQQPLPNTIRNRTDGDLHQLTLRPASKPRPATHISFRLVIRTVTGALMEKKLASRPTQGFAMSNATGGPSISVDEDYNVNEVESWSTRPQREEQAYESFRAEMERSAAEQSQRRAEIARGKRAMTGRYELVDEDSEGEYVPEQQYRETKLLNKLDEFTAEEYIRLLKLNDFMGTRYPCSETLAKLGLLEDVQYLFEKCHLETLMSYPYVAFKKETIHFLSTLQVELYQSLTEDELEREGLGFFTFSVEEQSYQLSIQRTVPNTDMEMIDSALTGILRQTKNGTILKGDLNNAPPVILLLVHLCGYKQWAVNKNKKRVRGALCVGGVVTPILIAFGVPITSTGKDARAIGFEHLRRIEFLEHGMVGEFYRYRFEHPLSKTANILLPCPEATSILGGENIDFEPAFEDLYIEFTQPMEEDAPAPDPAEDEIDDMDVDRDEEYDTSMYHFGEHDKKQEPEPSQRRPEPSEQGVSHVPARHSSHEPQEHKRRKKVALSRSNSTARLIRSRRSLDRGAGRSRRNEVEYPRGAEAATEQGDSSMAWQESQAGINDHLRSFFQ